MKGTLTEYALCQIFISNTISNNRNQGFLKKWLILWLRQKIYKMSLEYLIVPES